MSGVSHPNTLYSWYHRRERDSSAAYLSKLANVSNLPAFQAAEVRRDPAALEIHDPGERLIEEGADGRDREASSLCRESVDHGFESHVDFPGADDLGYVCCRLVSHLKSVLSKTDHLDHWAREEPL